MQTAPMTAQHAHTTYRAPALQDKKHRLYIITAAPGTKVDLGVLSARLGTGKGGVRFAPEEALDEVLKVRGNTCHTLHAMQYCSSNAARR